MISVDKQVDILFWHQEGKSLRWIGFKVQVSRATARAVVERGKVSIHYDIRKPNPSQQDDHGAYLPTTEEIAGATARIRASWSRAKKVQARSRALCLSTRFLSSLASSPGPGASEAEYREALVRASKLLVGG